MYPPIPPALERCYLALFCLLPWSLEWTRGGHTLLVPAEPLMGLAGLMWLFYALKHRRVLVSRWQAILHPGLFLSFAGWMWLLWCTAFSVMPPVSWKYSLVELAHWVLFALGMAVAPDLWRKNLPWLGVSMGLCVVYTLVHHSFYHFRADQSLLAPMPFFPEHTLYATVLTLLLPWCGYMAVALCRTRARALALGWGAFYLVGLWFAYCRAAWLSLVVALAAAGLWYMMPRRAPLVAVGAALALGAALWGLWVSPPGRVGGIPIADVSMLERLNRYACAREMATAQPLTGFGPGTYQFQYLAFQKPEYTTRISVTAPVTERSVHTYGRGGGAHSEYFQALAETGWPGLGGQLAFMAVLWIGLARAYRRTQAWVLLCCWAGLLTFGLHGLVNNFLHDARVAVLVWGMVGYYAGTTAQSAPEFSPHAVRR